MDFEQKTIEIKGTVFHVRELSAGQRQQVFKLYKEDLDPIELQANYIKMGCQEFEKAKIEDIMALPGKAFSDLAEEVAGLSGLIDEAESEKNS